MLPGGQPQDKDSCTEVSLWQQLLTIPVRECEKQDGADREIEQLLCCKIQSHRKLWSQGDLSELALSQVLEGQAILLPCRLPWSSYLKLIEYG